MAKEISMTEVKKHRTENSVWVVIQNDVYDLTKFLNEHPAGPEVLLEVAGQDATQPFQDVGHSNDAKELMKKYKIGSLPQEEKNKFVDRCSPFHQKCMSSEDDTVSRHGPPKSEYKAPSAPHVERRVQSIVVPRERSRRERSRASGSAGGSSNLKWALIALAGALIIGFAIKKYAT